MSNHLLFRSLFWATLSLINACGQQGALNTDSSTNSIITLDEREESVAHSQIGVLEYEGKPICTVFASNKNEVTTAAHCVNSGDLQNFAVKLNGQSKKIESAQLYDKADVAHLRVNGITNYFETAEFLAEVPAYIIGFASDKGKIMTSQKGVVQDSFYKSVLDHTFATVQGTSGAPLLQNGKVVGVHLGSINNSVPISPETNKNGMAIKNIAVKYANLNTADISMLLTQLNKEGWFKNLGKSLDKIGRKIDPTNPHEGLGKAIDQVGRNIDPTNMKTLTVCGKTIKVPLIFYSACYGIMVSLPASCSVGAAVTGGGSCALALTAAVATCGAGTTTIYEIGKACVNGGF